MNTKDNNLKNIRYYSVWDKTTRIFHWVNLACVLVLMAVGVVLFNDDALGVSSDGKILLKEIHVYVGYFFSLNLLWRLIWAFIGSRHARWGSFLPVGKSYFSSLKQYITQLKNKKKSSYLGHNPLAKIMVTLLLVFLLAQSLSGLVLAGTDLYLPPLGHEIAEWVTGGDRAKMASLEPGVKEGLDMAAYAEMRGFRKPFINLHKLAFFALIFLSGLHIAGVVFTELFEKNGIISAMITGEKVFSDKPVDMLPETADPEIEKEVELLPSYNVKAK